MERYSPLSSAVERRDHAWEDFDKNVDIFVDFWEQVEALPVEATEERVQDFLRKSRESVEGGFDPSVVRTAEEVLALAKEARLYRPSERRRELAGLIQKKLEIPNVFFFVNMLSV
ncbi:MAG: hypothetical protein Q7R83_04410, partial [bacterium]|nr:hypothetical protein [bacterium]